MFQLTIATVDAVTVTDHPDHAAAYRQLVGRAVADDLYVHTLRNAATGSSHRLLRLSPQRRHPVEAGGATIERIGTDGAARR